MSKIRPEVTDPHLRSTLDRVGHHIENYQQNLDTVSADIKAIENYLTASGIRVLAFVVIGFLEGLPDDQKEDAAGNYSGPIHRDVERIEWSAIDDTDRWRLNYFKFRRFGEVDVVEKIAICGPNYQGPVLALERKPLIETTVEVRLLAHPKLADLVSAVAKRVELNAIAAPVTDDDIPF